MFLNCSESDDIRQSDLAALSDDDLKLFGIEDAMLRREMLTRFSTLPNQSLHYDEYDFTKYIPFCYHFVS